MNILILSVAFKSLKIIISIEIIAVYLMSRFIILSLIVLAVAAASLQIIAKAYSSREITYSYDGSTVTIPSGYKLEGKKNSDAECQRLDKKVVYIEDEIGDNCPAKVIGNRAIVISKQQINRGTRSKNLFVYRYDQEKLHSRNSYAEIDNRNFAPQPLPRAATADLYNGFDTCAAPSLQKLQTWKKYSPYNTIGIYIGGKNRGCLQQNLNYQYLLSLVQLGYHFIPIYAGLQAPCMKATTVDKIKTGYAEGVKEAEDAVYNMKILGIPGYVYSDIEYFNIGNKRCLTLTLEYIRGFRDTLRATGYNYGVYSSKNGIMSALTRENMDAAWVAKWDGVQRLSPTLPIYRAFNPDYIKQYRGGHKESYGGEVINIDNDFTTSSILVW